MAFLDREGLQQVWAHMNSQIYKKAEKNKDDLTQYLIDELAKRNQLAPEFANSVEECIDQSKLYVLPDGYIYAYVTTTTTGKLYTNLLNLGVNESGETVDYIVGKRWSSSATAWSDYKDSEISGQVLTGMFPFRIGQTLRIKGVTTISSYQSSNMLKAFDADRNNLATGYTSIYTLQSTYPSELTTEDDMFIFAPTTSTSAHISDSMAYIAISMIASGNAEDIIITVDEEIAEGTRTESKWASTGHAFVPADYEDKIVALENDVSNLKERGETLNNRVASLEASTDGSVPDYVLTEAERVSAAVSAVRTSKSLVLLCASDIHTLKGNAQSVESALHLAQGMSEICKRVAVDGIAILGDSAFGSSTSTAEETKFAFAHLRENLVRGEHEIWIPGNHDHFGISDDGNYLSADELYSYIGANTTDRAVTDYDNLHRMYGYVDYDKQRIRVVYLNTSDITDSYASDYGMSTVQAQWFVDTLTAVPSGWGVVVMSHHPLNGYISTYLGTLTILDAYKGKESGSVTVGGGTVAYDFTNAQGELICHLHGHIHNYQVKLLGDNGILSITIPNGYFWRNNEYGTGGNADWGDEVDGEQRVIDKTAGTAEDTAYTAVVIDRKHGKVHALRCGAGVDRVWDYINGVDVGGDETPDEPDTPTTGYTNQIPISVNTDGSVYNGTGYKAGYRISTSQGTESAASGMTVTGYIPLPKADSVVRVKDIELNHTDSTMGRYTSDFTFAGGDYCNSAFGAADENGVRTFTNTSSNCQWIRISGVFGTNPIVTVDEIIG